MTKLNCPNCGAPIKQNSCKCEYCGTQFENHNGNLIKIETFKNPCKVYKTEIPIPDHVIKQLGEKEVSDLVIKQLSANLADAIAPNMELQTEYDPIAMTQRISARVRIVEPKYMF